MSFEEQIAEIMTERGLTVAVAETTAGGLVSSRLVSVPGSSKYFLLGAVAYSKESKVKLLGISEKFLKENGTVTQETAFAMAEAVRRVAGADIGLAETGIAGPIRGRSPKPIGTACIAVSTPNETKVVTNQYDGDRTAIREAIAEGVLAELLEYLTPRDQ